MIFTQKDVSKLFKKLAELLDDGASDLALAYGRLLYSADMDSISEAMQMMESVADNTEDSAWAGCPQSAGRCSLCPISEYCGILWVEMEV